MRVSAQVVSLIEIRLAFFQTFEAFALQGSLCVSDSGLDFAFAIGILDAAGESDCAVVRQHVAIEWIQRGIVDVGDEHAFAEIVEDDDARTAPETTKSFLMQLGPDASAGAERKETNRFPTAA
jgi:hypothetical protein